LGIYLEFSGLYHYHLGKLFSFINSPNASWIQDWRVKLEILLPLTSTCSIFLASCFLTYGEWIYWTTCQFGECLEKLIHNPVLLLCFSLPLTVFLFH
jgi:hypothetical protein